MSYPVDVPAHILPEAETVWQEAYIGTWVGQEVEVIAMALLAAEERGAARERERCISIVESGSNAALRLIEVNDPDEAEVRIVSFVLSKACTQLANKIRGNSA